ncbi:MAG: hypothetical protein DRG59_05025 [Deltaproteobacteria bacterium]|nr:MAG: hypothetical protein DRG59_05025 [Deltaproteobacteria bacterium]
MNNKNALVITLGSEPQVVTLTLHALKKQYPAFKIEELYVVHTSPAESEVKRALSKLKDFFGNNSHDRLTVSFVPVTDRDKNVTDIESVSSISAFFKTIFRLLRQLKKNGYTVYLNASGGRKPMAIYSTVAAQILFDENDKAFYLTSSRSLVESKSLTPTEPSHWTKLIEIPILPWSEVDPAITVAAMHDDILTEPDFWKSLHRHKRKTLLMGFVYVKLTDSERKILFEVIRKGGSSSEIAKRLGKSRKTVEHQLGSIYAKIKEWFTMPQHVKLNREFLIREFKDFI